MKVIEAKACLTMKITYFDLKWSQTPRSLGSTYRTSAKERLDEL
jgi:hypothetical protein